MIDIAVTCCPTPVPHLCKESTPTRVLVPAVPKFVPRGNRRSAACGSLSQGVLVPTPEAIIKPAGQTDVDHPVPLSPAFGGVRAGVQARATRTRGAPAAQGQTKASRKGHRGLRKGDQPVTELTPEWILGVPCPHCEAQQGDHCRNGAMGMEGRATMPHGRRVALAEIPLALHRDSAERSAALVPRAARR